VPRCEIAPGWAREINIDYLSRVMDALPVKTRLVYVSSDHVFGGDGVYDEFCAPCPISVYGRTRVEAEEIVLSRPGSLVLRIGLAIGPSPNGRTGHWDWLRYRTEHHLPMTIVHDEYRSVVWAHDLAVRVMQFARSTETGVRHITATRVLSRVELAHYLMSQFGMTTEFLYEGRHERSSPHLGRVELASIYRGELFRPLPSLLENGPVEMSEVR
jgi:dTDP-4-dehydrorhamnose reductase